MYWNERSQRRTSTVSMSNCHTKEPTMITNNQARQVLRRTSLAAALILTAAPVALADPPGYYFQDFGLSSPAKTSESSASTASDVQLASINRKADQALATAREALRQVQQTTLQMPQQTIQPTR
jgi:hypothetical protein